MKFLFSPYCPPIVLEEGCICTLVIENRPMFRTIVADIHEQINGERGDCVLSQNEAPIEMAKYMELFSEIIPFSCGRKTLLTKALNAVDRFAIQDLFEMTRDLSARIERYLLELSEAYSISFDADKIMPSGLLKLANAAIEEDVASPLDNMITYMDMVTELEREKVFCFLNLHGYFSVEELLPFFQTTKLRKHRLLLLETNEPLPIAGEKRVVIDEDLCAVIL